MTIKECIERVDSVKPNQYSTEEKIGWLTYMDKIIINEVLLTHDDYDNSYDDFDKYTVGDMDRELIAESPYDELYVAYLKAKIDEENCETARYANSSETFNQKYADYCKYYNKVHMPVCKQRLRVF